MHNNEDVLPHFIIQLVHLFAVLPPETAFLSVYESGSTDSTGGWCPLQPVCFFVRLEIQSRGGTEHANWSQDVLLCGPASHPGTVAHDIHTPLCGCVSCSCLSN